MNYCIKCGAELSAEAKFCSECGSKIEQETSTLSPPSITPVHPPLNLTKKRISYSFISIVMVVVCVSLIVGVIFIILAGHSNNESKYLGTWDIHSVNIEGSMFTIEEVETTGDYSMSDFRIIIKEGGKAYVYAQGYGEFVDWFLAEEGINIGVRFCTLQNGLLTIEINDNMIYLTKTSDSQTITAPEDFNNDNNSDANNTHTHTGGIATCIEMAICSICNEHYGELDSENHFSDIFDYSVNSIDNAKHDKKYSCCGAVVATTAHSGGTATTTQKARCEYCNISYGNVLSSFNWQLAGNGCGARIPEPSFEYDVKASSTYLCVEVHNTSEEDFYDYVNECRAYGFNGSVGSATTPDLYYMVYDAEEYYLEVFYYADDEYFYVFIRPPYDDSNDNNDDNTNDGNGDTETDTNEITEEELLLVKNIAESNNSKLDTYVSLATEYEYSGEKIDMLMNSCDVNWNEQAVISAEKYAASCDNTSPLELRSYLEYHDFDNLEIDYALEHCQIDWVEQAFLFIQDSLTYEVKWGNRDGWCGPAEIRMALNEELFDWDTIIYIESQIDWQEQVKLYMQHLSSFYPKFNRLDARGILGNGILANDAGISSVLETSGVDWKEHAFNIASEFYEENVDSWYYENRPPNAIYEDIERELLEVWDFTDKEVEYAINKVKEYHSMIS